MPNRGYCGLCFHRYGIKRACVGHGIMVGGSRPWKKERQKMALRKRTDGVDLGELCRESDKESMFGRAYPNLLDFLSLTEWPEEGGPRKTGSILIFVQDGYVKVRLVDNDQDLVAFWAGQSLADALRTVETDLGLGAGDWRLQKPFTAPKKK